MKFRAKISEITTMRQFSNIVHTLSKLSKTCVLRICEDQLYFIVPEDHNLLQRISVWSTLRRNEFFYAYVMKGETEANEILLEFSSDMLASSLSSVKTGSNQVLSLKIKLTHKVSPCITLELELASQSTSPQYCIHDVPVTIIDTAEWKDYQEPKILNYDVNITSCLVAVQMPNAKTVKNIIDKLKKIDSRVTITATSEGKFSLLAKTLNANIEVHFRDLHVKVPKKPIPADKISASVCVDIKKMSQFLTCDAIYPSTMTCNIVNGNIVHLCLSHVGFELNYYLTAIED